MQVIITTLFFTGMLATVTAQQPRLAERAAITTHTIVAATAITPEKGAILIVNKVPIGQKKAEDIGETVSTTWYQGNMVKTEVRQGNIATTTLRDNKSKETFVYAELIKNDRGQKIYSKGPKGFYTTDVELQMMDSIKTGLPSQANMAEVSLHQVKIDYIEEVKLIAGYACKKAIVHINKGDGQPQQIIAWYNTGLQLKGLPATGDPIYGFLDARKNKTLDILAQLKGFPMEYEMELVPGRLLKVTVTSLDIDKKIASRNFTLPEDAQLTSFLAYMQNPGDYKVNLGQVVTNKKDPILASAAKSPDQ